MSYPDQTARIDWHPLPDQACPPGHGEGICLGCFPASPPSPKRRKPRARNGLQNDRKLALLLTIAVWTLLASIAEIVRLAGPVATHM